MATVVRDDCIHSRGLYTVVVPVAIYKYVYICGAAVPSCTHTFVWQQSCETVEADSVYIVKILL